MRRKQPRFEIAFLPRRAGARKCGHKARRALPARGCVGRLVQDGSRRPLHFAPAPARASKIGLSGLPSLGTPTFRQNPQRFAASRADAQAAQNEYESALLSLRTQFAALYFSLREFEAEKILLEKTVEIRESETRFVRDRFEMQTATESDLQRATEQEFSAKAQLTDMLERIALAKNLAANLLGTTPAKLAISPAPLDGVAPEIPRVLPSELLERRADVAAAERAVCAANFRIGAAQAAFFPTVSITSSLGTESTAFSKLLNSSSFAWGVSPQVYIPIFQAGRLSAQKRVALAKHRESLEKYKATVLKAVRETEDALAKASLAKQRVSERAVAAAAAAKVEEFAQTQYEGGVADYFQAGEAHPLRAHEQTCPD